MVMRPVLEVLLRDMKAFANCKDTRLVQANVPSTRTWQLVSDGATRSEGSHVLRSRWLQVRREPTTRGYLTPDP